MGSLKACLSEFIAFLSENPFKNVEDNMDILKEIIAADKAAAARVEALRQEQEAALSASGKAAATADEKLVNDARQELESFRAEQQKLLDEKLNGAAAGSDAGKKRLDDIFSAHREEWISDIMGKVTGL